MFLNEEAKSRYANYMMHPLVQAVMGRLSVGLSPQLTYHTYGHTLDVIAEALNLSVQDSLDLRAEELLVIAAAYHDAGFLQARTCNEGLAAEMLVNAMVQAQAYSVEEQDLVYMMVLDTQIFLDPDRALHNCRTALSGYLIDADMANLGRPDFFDCLQALIIESRAPRVDYLHNTLSLVRRHRWFSAAASTRFADQKQKNALELEELVQLEGRRRD